MVLGSGIRDPGSGKKPIFRIPDPGVKKHPIPDRGSRIRIRNTACVTEGCLCNYWDPHLRNYGLNLSFQPMLELEPSQAWGTRRDLRTNALLFVTCFRTSAVRSRHTKVWRHLFILNINILIDIPSLLSPLLSICITLMRIRIFIWCECGSGCVSRIGYQNDADLRPPWRTFKLQKKPPASGPIQNGLHIRNTD